MEATLKVLNELEREGVIGRYAIGGAVGAIFYSEPFATFDLDVFVVLPVQGVLTTLEPLYAALRARGWSPESDCVLIEGVPVQFLPAFNALIEEALFSARDVMLAATPTRVLRAEHLAAIMVQTGRAKDRARLAAFLEQAKIDGSELESILLRHDLTGRFDLWTRPPNS
jgi:hypothetical protein